MTSKLLLTALLASFGSLATQAQCLSLGELTSIEGGHINSEWPADRIAEIVPFDGWTYRGILDIKHEYSWIYKAAGTEAIDSTETPAGILSVRANSPTHDVVLKTTSGACIRQIRSELNNQKLEPVAVTCLDCEGASYTAKTYSLSIYSKKKGPYPYVVVLRLTPQPVIVDNSRVTTGTLSGNSQD